MSSLNNTFDNDFDSFLTIESNDFTPIVSPGARSQQSFAGPTYQYDSHRQQTGLPMGGLANAFAVNQASGMHYRPNSMGYVMPTETLNMPLANNVDEFDFNQDISLAENEMDFDNDSPSDLFYAGNGGESSQSAPVQRIYPGMHSQQAAQAKAAQAVKQQEMLRQKQQKQLPGQQPLPTQSAKAPAIKDPHVEESISRLLNRMRQSSSMSAEDDAASPTGSMGNLLRPKKEEEDMDDDERLLASEEGKKLSSKERRQLRNKVSARAFRSRRKEYISQLEAEVQQKVQEANDLRVQNRQLMEENTRLTDLTRMLLSSQSFSGFLQELSNSGLPAPQLTNLPAAAEPSQPSRARKDVGAHEAARQLQHQNQPQINMAMIPENNAIMGGIDNWNSLPSNDFQVFSLTAIPQPPALDLSAISEKAPEREVSNKAAFELPSSPMVEVAENEVTEVKIDNTVQLDQTAFDLYFASPVVSTESASTITAESLIASLHKPEASADSTISHPKPSDFGSWAELEKLCLELDDACRRLSKFMPQSKQ